jgi:two-component system response regulator FixJ
MAERTVHIVDDDPAVCNSVRLLLETAGVAVATYESAAAFLAISGTLSGCVVTDLRMPHIDGFELQRRLAEHSVRLPVIAISGYANTPAAVHAMKAGAIDFLEKPLKEEQLLEAVSRALEESERLEREWAASANAAAKLMTLTPREREVLDLLVRGLRNKTIACELGASPRTIEVHRARVLEKLCAHSLPELVRIVLAGAQAKAPEPVAQGIVAGQS